MNRNSSLIWLPKIIEAGLPTPKTEVVPYNHALVVQCLESDSVIDANHEYERIANHILIACKKLYYPCFLRTDLSSAKHAGQSAYMIEDDEDIPGSLSMTLEDNEMKFWLEPDSNKPQAMLVREWLDLEAPFSAFTFHKIAREWRFFANADGVICFHPYWPEESIQFHGMSEPDGWRAELTKLHEIPDNIDELKAMAIKAAKVYGQTSSVDFARDVNGRWWLTDMAVAEDSFHWESCENKDIQIHRNYFQPQIPKGTK
jgi:hypothetical protein